MGRVICRKHGTSPIVCVSPDVAARVRTGQSVPELRPVEWVDSDSYEDEREDAELYEVEPEHWGLVSLVSPEVAAEHGFGEDLVVVNEADEAAWGPLLSSTIVCRNCLREAFEGDLDAMIPSWQ